MDKGRESRFAMANTARDEGTAFGIVKPDRCTYYLPMLGVAMPRQDTRPSDAGPQGGETAKIGHLDFPPLPVTNRTEPNDESRCPESFRLAHEGTVDCSISPRPSDTDFWVEPEPGRPRTFLQTGKKRLAKLASKDVPVLIVGAKGTGKLELARVIRSHELNHRRDKPFGVVDCEESQGADAIGAELFGHGKRESGRPGKLVACDGGTVLVRNLHRLPAECGRRLVHFLRHGEVRPLDSDDTVEGIDVRVLATTRDQASLPDALLEEFRERVPLLPLKDMKEAITIFLAESFRPYDAVKEVHVSWLLDLLCYDWPGNMGELRRYCDNAKDKAAEMQCTVLCAILQPIAKANRDSLPAVRPRQIVNSLLAFSERGFHKKDWPRKIEFPDTLANSLRLLVQLLDDGRNYFQRAGRGPFPYYYHPYRIPLALFFEGCRCPPCYALPGMFPQEPEPLCCLDEFLRKVAAIATDPSILAEDETFHAEFGADPHAVATLKPSPNFLNWVGWLKASVPKYEKMRCLISVPALPQRPNIRRKAITNRRNKLKKQKKLGWVTRVWPDNFHVDPREFAWHRVSIRYEHEDHRITFTYDGRTSKRWYIKEMKGMGSGKSDRALNQAGILLVQILVERLPSFEIKDVISWLSAEPCGNDGRLHNVSRDAAVQAVYRLNWALWDLVLDCPHSGDESLNAVTPSKGTGKYEVRFSIPDLETNHDDDQGRRSSSTEKLRSLPRARHKANADDRRSRPNVPDEETDRVKWSSRDPITGLPKGPGRDPNVGRSDYNPDDEQEDDTVIPFDRPGTPYYEPESGQES